MFNLKTYQIKNLTKEQQRSLEKNYTNNRLELPIVCGFWRFGLLFQPIKLKKLNQLVDKKVKGSSGHFNTILLVYCVVC